LNLCGFANTNTPKKILKSLAYLHIRPLQEFPSGALTNAKIDNVKEEEEDKTDF
jgi:hypothetical protein